MVRRWYGRASPAGVSQDSGDGGRRCSGKLARRRYRHFILADVGSAHDEPDQGFVDLDGRNHYPDDIEATIQEITGGRVVAISVPDGSTERLVSIVELKKRGSSHEEVQHRLRSVKQEVKSAIWKTPGVWVADLVLVAPGSIPITTSEKSAVLRVSSTTGVGGTNSPAWTCPYEGVL